MPLRDHIFIDSARYYPRDRATEKFTGLVTSGGSNPTKWTIGPSFGRDGRYGHRLAVGAAGPPIDLRFFKTIAPTTGYGIMSFAFRRNATQSNAVGTNSIPIAAFYSVNNPVIHLVINQDGTLSVIRGDWGIGGGTFLGTTSLAIPLNEFYHIEWRCKFTSPGATTVWINGAQALNLTNQSMGGGSWNVGSWGTHMGGFQFSGTFSAANHDYCDIILRDGTVRVLFQGDAEEPSLLAGTDPWGDTRIICCLSQTGNGTHTDWDPSSGFDHGAMVSEAQENADTNYVSTNTANALDTYTMEDLPFDVGEVLGVQLVSAARKEVGGTAFVKGKIVIGGDEFETDHTVGLGTSFIHILSPMVTHGGDKFTVPEINDCESGPLLVHITAGDDNGSSNTGDPGDPPDPPPDSGSCTGTGTPYTFGMPTWLADALSAVGATDCYNPNLVESIETIINSAGMALQRNSGCQFRGRLHEGTLTQTFCGHPMVNFNLPVTDHNIEHNGQWHWD